MPPTTLTQRLAPGLAALALAAGCNAPAAPPAQGGAGGAPTTRVSFKADVAPILKASCAGCHAPGGSGPQKFLTQAGEVDHAAAAAVAGSIVRSVEAKRMPKGSNKLTQAQIDALKAWQAAGAPND